MRTWPGLAAVGAGLIHLGIAAGSTPALLALLVVVGGIETCWGVVALSGRPAGRAALAGASLLAGGLVVLLLVPAGPHHTGSAAAGSGVPLGVPDGAMIGAGVLDLAVAVLVSLGLRRGSAVEPKPGAGRFLLGTAVAAASVAIVTTTSLASTVVGGHTH